MAVSVYGLLAYEVTALLPSRGPSGNLLPTYSSSSPRLSLTFGALMKLGQSRLSIRMVAEYRQAPERKKLLVAEARYVPNRQLLSILFRSDLVHGVHELRDRKSTRLNSSHT